jgi:hypothetical protein
MKLSSKLAALVLLTAMLATSAGAACMFPVAIQASTTMPGCHHRAPAAPHTGDHHCCLSSRPSALPATISTPASVAQISFADEPAVLLPPSRNVSSTTANPSPGIPPDAFILRI